MLKRFEELPERRVRTTSCPSRTSFEEESNEPEMRNSLAEHQMRNLHAEGMIPEQYEETLDEDNPDARDLGDVVIEDIPYVSRLLPRESRISPYPASGVKRFNVPDHYVDWNVSIIANLDTCSTREHFNLSLKNIINGKDDYILISNDHVWRMYKLHMKRVAYE